MSFRREQSGYLREIGKYTAKLRQRKGNGIAFTLIPENPIIAFQKFHFNEKHNWIYLHIPQSGAVPNFMDAS